MVGLASFLGVTFNSALEWQDLEQKKQVLMFYLNVIFAFFFCIYLIKHDRCLRENTDDNKSLMINEIWSFSVHLHVSVRRYNNGCCYMNFVCL